MAMKFNTKSTITRLCKRYLWDVCF